MLNYSAVYRILVKAGARPEEEVSFVHSFERGECSEWRFQGRLGFGGKYRKSNVVDCYREDETPARKALIASINNELLELAAKGI